MQLLQHRIDEGGQSVFLCVPPCSAPPASHEASPFLTPSLPCGYSEVMKSATASGRFVRTFILIPQLIVYACQYFIGCFLCFHELNFVASAPQNGTKKALQHILRLFLCSINKVERVKKNKHLFTWTCTYCDAENGSWCWVWCYNHFPDTWTTGANYKGTGHIRSLDAISADYKYIWAIGS